MYFAKAMTFRVDNLPYGYNAHQLAGVINSEGFEVKRACVLKRIGLGLVEISNAGKQQNAIASIDKCNIMGKIVKAYAIGDSEAEDIFAKDFPEDFYYENTFGEDDDGVETISDDDESSVIERDDYDEATPDELLMMHRNQFGSRNI
jgi:hypothetical protein